MYRNWAHSVLQVPDRVAADGGIGSAAASRTQRPRPPGLDSAEVLSVLELDAPVRNGSVLLWLHARVLRYLIVRSK
jgi:hypothetical protein